MLEARLVNKQKGFPSWKAFVFGLAAPGLSKLLTFWLPEPAAWGFGYFVACRAVSRNPS